MLFNMDIVTYWFYMESSDEKRNKNRVAFDHPVVSAFGLGHYLPELESGSDNRRRICAK